MAGSVRKDVLKYWRSVLKDKSAEQSRRDKAAAMLSRLVNQRERARAAKIVAQQNKEAKGIIAERTARNTDKRVEAAIGKKAVKREGAQTLASNNEWDDLIPKAKVIPLRKAAAK
jgi:hypothetical protein